MLRALLLAAALSMLAACSQSDALGPFAESATPPGLSADRLAPEGWAWGLLQIGDHPPQRYGVASPPVAPCGNVLILPGYGETAEAWFDAVHALNARGLTVWILDRAAQGGSGRFVSPRDLGHAPSFEPDIAAVQAMIEVIVRKNRSTPMVLLARRDAAAVALPAVDRGVDVDILVLEHPWLDAAPPVRPSQGWVGRLFGADRRPPPGWSPWSRSAGWESKDHRRLRSAPWQLLNPDLRMAAPSRGWRRAFAEASASAASPARPASTPVRLAGEVRGTSPCTRRPACRPATQRAAGPSPGIDAILALNLAAMGDDAAVR